MLSAVLHWALIHLSTLRGEQRSLWWEARPAFAWSHYEGGVEWLSTMEEMGFSQDLVCNNEIGCGGHPGGMG